jgi:PIN domain nuclease of toxin-antitoxin system
MRLLLDTHVWLWAVMEPERLNSATRSAIEVEPELVLSVASLWEMAIKLAAGKLRVEGSLDTFRLTASQRFSPSASPSK